MISSDFWRGKKVFLTGHTGFKGSWISLWLTILGAEVRGFSLQPPTLISLFQEANINSLIDSQIGDIRDKEKLFSSMTSFNPDILIHMAAQPLVRYSYDEPLETFEINVIGTATVLDVARSCSRLKVILNVTTDKCYENDGREIGYNENDPMGGYDPYSSSKGCSELLSSSYRRSYFQSQGIELATVRAGNVIGGGDWANDRLIPDVLRSFEINQPVIIRNPKATRPWQHVLSPLSGYLVLAQKMFKTKEKYAESWNFGPNEGDVKSVEWILNKMCDNWPNSNWELSSDAHPHEAKFLKLNSSKAQKILGWRPIWDIEYALEKIIIWHKSWLNNDDMQSKCILEIKEYMRDMDNEIR
jgi:CDP-glucose 4,6-dehydratase